MSKTIKLFKEILFRLEQKNLQKVLVVKLLPFGIGVEKIIL